MKILLGSNNADKLQEIRYLLPEFTVLCPRDLGLEMDVDENGSTYAENALIKARAFSKASGLLTMADDSGLEVACLGGEPGIYSARYCPVPGADYSIKRRYLIEKIRAVGAEQPWAARFCCCVALVSPNGEEQTVMRTLEGEVIPEERGDGGFGYDPIFFVPEFGQTNAEMSKEQKNSISHRGKAVRAALPLLREMAGKLEQQGA